MRQALRLLLVEDYGPDAVLMVRELRRAGYEPEWRRVETEAAFVAALDTDLDVILSDYHLPQFDGLQALRIARLRRHDVPFIMVTGSLGEEVAVDCIKEGAADLVVKDRLARLGPAVARALEEVRLRHENEQAHAEIREVNASLVESEHRYRTLFDNLLNGYAHCRMIFEGDRPVDFEYLEVNHAFETLTGLHDVVGRWATQIFPGLAETHPELLAIYGRVARGALPHRFELFFTPLELWLAITAYHAGPDEFVAVFDNITERRRAEERLRESEARLQVALSASNIGPWDWNIGTNEVYLSPEWKRQIGFEPHEITGEFGEFESRLHPDDHDRILAAVRAYLADPAAGYNVEFRFRHKNGSYRWIRTGGTLVRDEAGRPIRMIGCHLDVTDEKLHGLEREQLTRRLQLILDSTGEGIYGVDVEGRCTFVNRAACTTLGWPADALLGQDMHPLIHHSRADGTPYPREACPVVGAQAAGRSAHVEGEAFWRRDGTSLPVECSVAPVREGDVIVGAVVTFADVSGRQEMEAQLRQAHKLEAVGQLTGGVAHDFNNLLTAILGFSQFLDESFEPGDPRRGELAEIRNAATRAADLTRQLLAFSRRQILNPKTLSINGLVTDLAGMLDRLIGEHIELRTVLAGDLAFVHADPGQVQQVIVNLVVNAGDAMPNGGHLTVETANVLLSRVPAVEPAVAPGPFVRLRIRDTGIGMDAEVKKRVFEPFFTTKPVGKGTGLGLSTVYGIVRQSGGFVEIDSAVGHGTTVDVYFPQVEGTPEPVAARPGRVEARGSETILLVEDDAAIRDFTRRALEKRGYRVVTAENPEAARQVLAAEAGAVDLLIADVVLPGEFGPALYRELSALRPRLRVLFISGYAEDAAGVQDAIDGRAFLQKPFDGDDLAKKVREALDAPGTAGPGAG